MSTPIATSVLTARGVSPSPHTLSLGNRDFSISSTFEPGLRQVIGGGGARRSGADDDHVGVVVPNVLGHVSSVTCCILGFL